MTVKKAYDALEQEGFIVTVHGKGSFVAAINKNVALEEQRREVEAAFEEAIRKARSCGMTKEEISQLLDIMMEVRTLVEKKLIQLQDVIKSYPH